MRQPEGFIDAQRPDKVCRLRKSLYGLKQSARCWNKKINDYLISEGYSQNSADPCVYIKGTINDGKMVIVAVYVDDTIIASACMNSLIKEKVKLGDRFEMDDRGEIHHLLGMRIQRNRISKVMTIDQYQYLSDILRRFGIDNCRPVGTPMNAGKHLQPLNDDEDPYDTTEYQALIGSLLYLSICTHPDICTAVNYLSQFISRPGPEHWIAAKRILR